MTPDGRFPSLGPTGRTLGARVPPDPHKDVTPDAENNVGPDRFTSGSRDGMSVAPTVVDLPLNRLPREWRHVRPDARGKAGDKVFRFGTGPFVRASVHPDLELVPDEGERPTHGVLQPAVVMQVDAYQTALAATREGWRIVEPSEGEQ